MMGHKEPPRSVMGAMPPPAIKSPVFQKWAIAVLVSGILALLFSTNISLLDYSYKVGDIAVINVRASHDIQTQDVDIKRGEIVVRAGDRVTESTIKKLKVVQQTSYNKGFFIYIFCMEYKKICLIIQGCASHGCCPDSSYDIGQDIFICCQIY